MKQLIRNSFFVFTMISLAVGSVSATSVVEPGYRTPFNPGISPAPAVVIPFVAPPAMSFATSDAVKAFKDLSKAEKKAKVKEVKAAIKEFKKQKKNGSAEPSTNTLLLVILAILLPPLAVYLHEGAINNKFWISLILTLLFFLPGVIYALVVVLDGD